METINVKLKLNHEIYVHVELDNMIDTINNARMERRWNLIAKIINGVQLNLSELTDEQKGTIKEYLANRLSLFN